MPTINFPSSVPLTSTRPYADVILSPGHKSACVDVCLVDTGADFLMLPVAAGQRVGLLPSGTLPTSSSGWQRLGITTRSVLGVGGSLVCPFVTGVTVEIEGHRVPGVDVLFDLNNRSELAGRQLIQLAFRFGLTRTEWLHT